MTTWDSDSLTKQSTVILRSRVLAVDFLGSQHFVLLEVVVGIDLILHWNSTPAADSFNMGVEH